MCEGFGLASRKALGTFDTVRHLRLAGSYGIYEYLPEGHPDP